MTEYNLPEKDDAPWLNTQYDGFMTHEEMLEEAAKREAANKAFEALDKLYDENGDALKKLAEIESNEAIVVKVSEEAERRELANKTFEELTKDEKIKLALEELAAIVMGGQDGEEFYNSVKFIKEVLESFKDT